MIDFILSKVKIIADWQNTMLFLFVRFAEPQCSYKIVLIKRTCTTFASSCYSKPSISITNISWYLHKNGWVLKRIHLLIPIYDVTFYYDDIMLLSLIQRSFMALVIDWCSLILDSYCLMLHSWRWIRLRNYILSQALRCHQSVCLDCTRCSIVSVFGEVVFHNI